MTEAERSAKIVGIKLPLGFDLFDKVRESDCYYIDKTGLIDNGAAA